MKTKRPKPKPEALDHRYMIRTTKDELERWDERARAFGFNGAGPWLRFLANREMDKPTP